MVPIGRLPEFTGKTRDVPWCNPTTSIAQRDRCAREAALWVPYPGFSVPTALTDATASLSGPLLPRNRDTGSYGYHMLNSIH